MINELYFMRWLSTTDDQVRALESMSQTIDIDQYAGRRTGTAIMRCVLTQ